MAKEHNNREMATISRPEDNIPHNTVIVVYRENDEGNAKAPHFHVLFNNVEREFEIAFEHVFELHILNYNMSWEEYEDVKTRIIEWLNETPERNMGITNLQRMVMAWNDENTPNEIDMEYCE